MDFQYNALDLDRPSFRILRLLAGYGDQPIECQLIEASFDEDLLPDYEAVSYTWGGSLSHITVDDAPFPIQKNLRSVLHDVRYPDEDRILWIDAICINQDSHGERGHQVRQMDQIYQRASRVVVWLGPLSSQPTRYLMEAVADLHKQFSGIGWPTYDTKWHIFRDRLHEVEIDQVVLRTAFRDILKRPWFYRAWIIQEVANARATIVHCGSKSIPGKTFAILPALLDIPLSAHQQAIFDVMPGPSRVHSWWSEQRDLYTILQKFIGTHASRDHDRIYALLSLCSTEEKAMIPVDYTKPIHEVVNDTLFVICLSGTRIDHTLRPRDIDSFARVLPFVHLMGFSKWCPQIENDFEELWKALYLSNWTTTNDTFHGDPWSRGGRPSLLQVSSRHGSQNGPITSWVKRKYRNLAEKPELVPLGLLVAARGRSEPIVQLLLDLGTNVHEADAEGRTALHEASENGSRAIVETLLARGFDPQTKDRSGRNPLDEAAKAGRADIANLLLEHGGDPDGVALFDACAGGHEAVVRLLLDVGADPNKTNDRGESPFLLAVRRRHFGVVKLLLDRGADLTMGDNQGVTPLLEAVEQISVSMVQLLLGQGANPNQPDEGGLTPLTLANQRGVLDIIRLLKESEAREELI